MKTVKIVNVETQEEIFREMNDEELKISDEDELTALEENKIREKNKEIKEALLVKLNLTEDEAKLLLS